MSETEVSQNRAELREIARAEGLIMSYLERHHAAMLMELTEHLVDKGVRIPAPGPGRVVLQMFRADMIDRMSDGRYTLPGHAADDDDL